MNNRVPLYFTHESGVTFGEFIQVSGAGSTEVFFLMVDDYYKGRLRFSNKWIFDGAYETLAEDFGLFLTFLKACD
ncbi:MAG: hypothetical protein EOP48_29685 [Sphingobacteriales bacterium]|nr:MAG: hypothetical protein EOP48_29685 [Sphingobacteriales bacterium]